MCSEDLLCWSVALFPAFSKKEIEILFLEAMNLFVDFSCLLVFLCLVGTFKEAAVLQMLDESKNIS